MRKLLMGAAALLAAGAFETSTSLAAPSANSNPATCFDGASEGYGNGVCTQQGNKFTLNNPGPGDYSGVYVAYQSLAGASAGALTLSFEYSGATSGGSPRYSIPLDANNTPNTTEGYLFVDTQCDVNHDGVVNLSEPGCIVADSFGYYGPYSAYGAAYKVANNYTFVIADQPGVVTIKKPDLARTPPGKIK